MNPTDEVPILYNDLLLLQAALQNGLGLAAACDLQTKFQSLARNPRDSALVKQLREARDRVEGYLVTNDEPDDQYETEQ